MDALFDLPSEYKDLRASVRSLAENEIAPHAQAVDEEHRFPQEAFDSLQKAGLAASHVPTEFGGEGADALGVVIIIEEVARVCGSSSLIPAVNKLRFTTANAWRKQRAERTLANSVSKR